MKVISRTVWILSLVSFFNDLASEMLYPVMPMFLQQAGYTVIFIGILEGIAEAVAGLTKSYFGKRSDALGKRLPFIQLGYALSAISKPMMAVFIFPAWIFLARTMDRLGKGIRTGARDAMLSQESTPETKGRIFGFHRSLDTLGAVVGPAIALLFLYFYPGAYASLFLIAFIPGLCAIISTRFIKEKQQPVSQKKEIINRGFFSFASYWKIAPRSYKKLAMGLLIFALINSSDIFLLLKMKDAGVSDTVVISIYIFYNLVFAILAFPLGKLADKTSLKNILVFGLIMFALVYIGFSFANNLTAFIILFACYGAYAAATDGISKALIADIVPATETASAIGTFAGFQSICALIASTLCGMIWFYMGATAAFMISACVTFLVVIYLLIVDFKRFSQPASS